MRDAAIWVEFQTFFKKKFKTWKLAINIRFVRGRGARKVSLIITVWDSRVTLSSPFAIIIKEEERKKERKKERKNKKKFKKKERNLKKKRKGETEKNGERRGECEREERRGEEREREREREVVASACVL